MLEIDPNHERAKMNEEYYKGELNEMKLKMANGSAQNLFAFKNERPENKYKYDDQKYQALCRGESTKVTWCLHKNDCFLVFYTLYTKKRFLRAD
jgi:hypothetical protein